MKLEGWDGIKWKSTEIQVRKLQKRIYTASKEGTIQLVRKLQTTLISSWQAKTLAVRRVTQDNQGKKTAGVDGQKLLNKDQRFELASQLKIPTKAKPLRRVWIPKPGKTEKRPLGIPTLRDRALQTLLKMAIEPEWEAKFEPNSYGFRPGKNAHDALKTIQFSLQKRAKFVFDADIKKCFDKINHEALLNKMGLKGKMREQIKYWLKAGVLDNGVFTETEEGTPQGGTISPLLANIALHGMETLVKDYVESIPDKYPSGGSMNKRDRRSAVSVIRFADDFVILHHSLDIILKAKEIVKRFLAEIGLEISEEKSGISHSLEIDSKDIEKLGGDNTKPGFDFLGFSIKQMKTKYKSARIAIGPLGFRTLIVPSQKTINKHVRKLGEIIRRSRSLKQEALILKLNPIITGWGNYFLKSNAYTLNIPQKLDYLLYLKLRKWSKARSKTSNQAAKCWVTRGTRKWVFASKRTALYSYLDYSQSINSYEKAIGERSPFEGDETYWAKRMGTSYKYSKSQATLLKAQKGRCNWCKLMLDDNDVIETDHIIPHVKGGSNKYTNLQLLHRHCHDAKTKLDGSLSTEEEPLPEGVLAE